MSLSIGENLKRFAVDVEATDLPVANHVVLASAATTLQVQGGAASGNIGRTNATALNYRRRFIILDTLDLQGQVKNFPFNYTDVSVATGTKPVFMAVLQQQDIIAGAQASWDNAIQSGTPTGFIVAPIETTGPGSDPGHNVDNSGSRAVFAVPTAGSAGVLSDEVGTGITNPESGSLDAVINEAKQSALANGQRYAVVLAFSENESDTAQTFVRYSNITSGAHTLYPSPLDGWVLDIPPQVALPTLTLVDIGLMFGKACPATPTLEITWYDSDGVLVDSLTESAYAGDVGEGDRYWFEDVEVDASFSYEITVTAGGISYTTPRFAARRFVPAGTPGWLGKLGDDHFLESTHNTPDGVPDQGFTSLAGVGVVRATHDSLKAQMDSDEPISGCLHIGDGPEYTLGSTTWFNYPIKEDGTGEPDTAVSSIIGTADQALAVTRHWLRETHYPCESLALLVCVGNHACFTADQATERDWTLAALRYNRLIPHEENYRGYWCPVYDAQTIGDYEFTHGDCTYLVHNVGYDVVNSGTNPCTTATALNSSDDWIVDDTRRDAIIARIASAAAATTFHTFVMHQTLGAGARGQGPANPDGGVGNYGRSDFLDVLVGFYGTHYAPVQRLFFAMRGITLFGHDHIWDKFVKELLLYIYLASCGRATTPRWNHGPYSARGFATSAAGAGNVLHFLGVGAQGLLPHDPSFGPTTKGNAGWGLLGSSSTRTLDAAYISTRVVTEPVDYSTSDADYPRSIAAIAHRGVVDSHTLTAYLAGDPIESITDSFDEAIEDSVAAKAAGNEQDPLDSNEPGKHAWNQAAVQWTAYSSDDESFLAVRDSLITPGINVLRTRRPTDAEAEAVIQGIRRVLSPTDRTIAISTRVEGDPSALIGMIQICGGDADPNFASTPVGLGIFMVYDDVRAAVRFDDGSTVAALTGTLTLSPSIEDTMGAFVFNLVGLNLTVTLGGASLASVTLTQAQRDYLDDTGHNWVGLAARANNVTNEGFNVEWKDFSAEEATVDSGTSTTINMCLAKRGFSRGGR